MRARGDAWRARACVALAFAPLAYASLGARGGCGPAGPSGPSQTDTCAAGTPPPADGAATVQLGRDVTGPFQPMVDGDALPLNFGPQGGQHVYVTVHLFAPAAGSWRAAMKFVDEASTIAGDTTIAIDACAGWNTSQKVRVFMNTSSPHTGALSIVASPPGATAGPSETVRVSVAPP